MAKCLLFLVLLLGLSNSVFAAVGCDLNDPDRDVKRLFPESTGYKTEYFQIEKFGGKPLLKEVEERLADKFQGLYETIDVPYTIYTVFKGKETIGYIHGVNQKSLYGGMQVFLGYDPKGSIINFYYQKLTSRKAAELRSKEFGRQFSGLAFSDLKDYDPKTGKTSNPRISAIKNPTPDDETDFKATFRAVKKNMILMDIFIFSKRGKAEFGF